MLAHRRPDVRRARNDVRRDVAPVADRLPRGEHGDEQQQRRQRAQRPRPHAAPPRRSAAEISPTRLPKSGEARNASSRRAWCGASMSATTRPGRGERTTTRRQEGRLEDVVGHEQHGRPGLPAPDLEQLVLERLSGHLVERPERLVHQQQPWTGDERAGDRDAHPHAAGELARQVTRVTVEADQLERSIGCRAALAPRDAAQGERQRDVVADGRPRQQRRVLEDVGDATGAAGRSGVGAHDGHRARGRLREAGDQAEDRRAAAARGPSEGDQLTGRDREVERRERARAVRERLLDAGEVDRAGLPGRGGDGTCGCGRQGHGRRVGRVWPTASPPSRHAAPARGGVGTTDASRARAIRMLRAAGRGTGWHYLSDLIEYIGIRPRLSNSVTVLARRACRQPAGSMFWLTRKRLPGS